MFAHDGEALGFHLPVPALYFCSFVLRPPVSLHARYASAVTDGSQYFILLIISDGVITDMAQTKESIVNVQYHITSKLCLCAFYCPSFM